MWVRACRVASLWVPNFLGQDEQQKAASSTKSPTPSCADADASVVRDGICTVFCGGACLSAGVAGTVVYGCGNCSVRRTLLRHTPRWKPRESRRWSSTRARNRWPRPGNPVRSGGRATPLMLPKTPMWLYPCICQGCGSWTTAARRRAVQRDTESAGSLVWALPEAVPESRHKTRAGPRDQERSMF